MRLTEVEGKALLRRHGIATPRGLLLDGDALPEAARGWGGLVLKAQVLEGGRGKRGLVRLTTPAGLAADCAAMRALLAPETRLLLEEAVEIGRELYVALRIDGTAQAIELLASAEGGISVEEHPERLIRLPIHPEAPEAAAPVQAALRAVLPAELAARVARLAVRLARVMVAEDFSLLEVNPLVVTASGALLACDAKLLRDNSAGFRHDAEAVADSARLEGRGLTVLEGQARAAGFTLVEMPGDVAMVTGGAGLGMLMLDLLADAGLRAACFMDNRAGGPAETTEARLDAAFALARRPEVKAILFYTTLASRPLVERVDALLAYLARHPAPKPVFAGFAAAGAALRGFDAEAARQRMAAAGAVLRDDPRALVQAVAEACGSG